MSYSLSAIRSGLKTNLDTLGNVQVTAYLQTNVTPPTIQLFPAAQTYHLGMQNGTAEVMFTVQALVAATLSEAMQRTLDTWLGEDSGSIKAAIESDPTLGGIVSDVTVISRSEPKFYAGDARPTLLGAEWTVRVVV